MISVNSRVLIPPSLVMLSKGLGIFFYIFKFTFGNLSLSEVCTRATYRQTDVDSQGRHPFGLISQRKTRRIKSSTAEGV